MVEPPVLSRADFAEIPSQLHEPGVPFVLRSLLPGQDVVDLRQHKQCSPAIEFWSHWQVPVSRQDVQANQGRSLPAGA
jgi:hypothetical protein